MKCKHHKTCLGYRDNSETCNNGGGNYCGIYRKLNSKKLLLTLFSVLFLIVLVGGVSAVGTTPQPAPITPPTNIIKNNTENKVSKSFLEFSFLNVPQ